MTVDDKIKTVLSSNLLNNEKFELVEHIKYVAARESFFEFRRYMHPKNKNGGWWQKDVASNLQQFYDDLSSGLRPKLVIEAPPQHGKSVQIIDFIAWLSGKNSDVRTIYTSFSERLGIRANLSLQRMMASDRYHKVFPLFEIPLKNSVTISAQKLRNREIIEFVNGDGYFRNTTVQGSITGESLDLGVIDDPIRGRKDANSITVRNSAWDWFTDDFFTRFSEEAGLLCILTRWHVDDPIGRLIEANPSTKVCKYRAIAEGDEVNRKDGEALFPEHKSLEFLMERKSVMPRANFQALYQQSPIVQGGEMFSEEWWNYYTILPQLKRKVIYADTAIKVKEMNDYSVFQCWGESLTGQAYLVDQIRGKWEAPELLQQCRAFYNKHRSPDVTLSAVKVEDKASGTQLIQTLRREGIPIVGIPRHIDKITRAMSTLPLIESGNVYLPEDAHWLSDYLTEFGQFPNGTHDDQVDPTMDAITDILGGNDYNIDAW